MNVGSRQEHMDARPGSSFNRLPGALDIRRAGAGQPGDDGTPNGRRNRLHCGKIAFRGDGEAGFDDVHAQAVELVRQAQLFLHVHAASGRLLAIAKRGVEYRDPGSFHAKVLLQVRASCYVDTRSKENLIIIGLVLDIVTK